MRIKEAARHLGVSVRTFYRVVSDGHLHIVRVRGCACIAADELDRYMNQLVGGKVQ